MLNNFDKNKSPFKVPENYFRDFNSGIMDKLPQKELPKAKIVPLWRRIAPWTAVAAAFCGVLFMLGVFDKGTLSDSDAFADSKGLVANSGIAVSSSMEDDYFSFLEDEVANMEYRELMFDN